MGGVGFATGYVSSINVVGQTNSIIQASAELSFYGVMTGSLNGQSLSINDSILIGNSNIGITNKLSLEAILSFSFSISSNVSPNYCISSEHPYDFSFLEKERTMTLAGTNLTDFVSVYGDSTISQITVRDHDGIDLATYNISGVAVSNDLRVDEFGILQGSISMNQKE
jgi:hypothetical protein